MSQALDVVGWDLRCTANNRNHRTNLNGVDRLIVRRGQPFTVTLQLGSGTFQPGDNTFSLIVQTGPCSSDEKGTKATINLNNPVDKARWSGSALCSPGNTVSLSICSPPDAPIGRYSLTLDQGSRISLGEFVLLFNPWCPGDAVFMISEDNRREYVLSQNGLIYRGTSKYIQGSPWNFGQFESGVLDACLRILDENPKHKRSPERDCSGRGNPVYVTRVLSAMINCNDDNGVLRGKWGGDYSSGKLPSYWKDSVEILRQWNASGCKPVHYGQCWVFAAVACTAARALGIPCRVVTNFDSAHDTNGNLVIEYIYDENGQSLHKESVWNFHVWVESWMTRPDLKPGYGGWQASDPTPQEMSEGVYCCGPVPLKAIKQGELTMKYDAAFVFAEVNADITKYIQLRDGSKVRCSGSTSQVGKCISTKSVGSCSREDITHLYKYPEGSAKERKVFEKASHRNRMQALGAELSVRLKIKVCGDMRKGGDFEAVAVVSNDSAVSKTFRLVFHSQDVSYDGKLFDIATRVDTPCLQIPSCGEKQVSLRIGYSQYKEAMTQDHLIQLVALLFDKDTNESFNASRTIVLENPEIKIKIPEEPRVNHKLTAVITLQNPLPEPLENCSFTVEGANLIGGRIMEKIHSVGPGRKATMNLSFTPTCTGITKLQVDFNSDKLCHIKGFKSINIGK